VIGHGLDFKRHRRAAVRPHPAEASTSRPPAP
jgi:hypothetical protein